MLMDGSRRSSFGAFLLCILIGCLTLNGWAQEVLPGKPASPVTRQEILLEKRRAKLKHLQPEFVSTAERRILTYEKHPFWQKLTVKGYRGVGLRIGGLPSGSGFAYGLGYVNGLDRESVRFSLDARYSTRKYEQIDALAEFPTTRSDLPIRAFINAQYRDHKEINFFGLGNVSSSGNDASFRLEERSVGGGFIYDPHPAIEIGGNLGFRNTHIGVSDDDDQDIAEFFDVDRLPGFRQQADFLDYGGYARFKFFDQGLPPVGLGLTLELQRFDARGDSQFRTGSFNFLRAAAQFDGEIPLGYRNRRIAFRIRTSHSMADSGDQVPFYLLETIGGAATLRGFEEYRFRDLRNLVINLEYRWEVWHWADFALFSDAGKVFRRAGDLDFSDLHASYGIGILLRLPGMRLRFDVGRSNEGIQFHIGSGVPFHTSSNPLHSRY